MTFKKRCAGVLPLVPIDLSSESQNIRINLTGLSSDSIRTTIYYRIDNNPDDYQVQDAFLVDDQDRSYPLTAVERKTGEQTICWMEFSPVSFESKKT
jgi:hypothetical protein